MSIGEEKDKREYVGFPGKIGHRLTVALAFLLTGVLLVGGASLYMANSISENTERIKRISQEIQQIDQAHFTMHHLIEQLNLAVISGKASEAKKIPRYITELEHEIRDYRSMEATGYFGENDAERSSLRAVAEEIPLLTRGIEEAGESVAQGIQINPQGLADIHTSDNKLRVLFRRLNRFHNDKISHELSTSRNKMKVIMGVYLAFFVVGGFGLVGWSWLMSKTIVSPIHRLASAAHDIAAGQLDMRVPVTSTDELGQLSHSFNFMAERIRDHEETLKGFATLQERERIAQELHDSLAQAVALLHLKIAETEQHLSTDGVSSARESLKEMRQITSSAYDEVRQAIFGLRTMVSKGLGLIPTLTEYLHDFSERKNIPVDLKLNADAVPELPMQVEVQLIRIIHEALTNIFKHAEATKSEVRVEPAGESVKVIVEDNGKGFRLDEIAKNGFHFGLKTMRERAHAVSGELTVETEPGEGTRVIIDLPIEKKASPDHFHTVGR